MGNFFSTSDLIDLDYIKEKFGIEILTKQHVDNVAHKLRRLEREEKLLKSQLALELRKKQTAETQVQVQAQDVTELWNELAKRDALLVEFSSLQRRCTDAEAKLAVLQKEKRTWFNNSGNKQVKSLKQRVQFLTRKLTQRAEKEAPVEVVT